MGAWLPQHGCSIHALIHGIDWTIHRRGVESMSDWAIEAAFELMWRWCGRNAPARDDYAHAV